MLRQEQYQRISDEFGVGLGVAEWEGEFYPHYTNIRKMPDEMKIIILTNYIIKAGTYQQVQREIWRLKNKYGKRNIKESTIYEKAITNIMG